MINDVSTIFELVKVPSNQRTNQLRAAATHSNGSKYKSSGKVSRLSESRAKGVKMAAPLDEDDDNMWCLW
ncbi:hypothetical protein RIF29_17500 [Crotalaria pallida]|uniref:Uncharacterized protein n=1 Tax=Crotalaria pallida TaxID=3830 RepID=A0AAN9FKP2_CROPI